MKSFAPNAYVVQVHTTCKTHPQAANQLQAVEPLLAGLGVRPNNKRAAYDARYRE